MNTRYSFNHPIIKELGELLNQTPFSILAADTDSGAPVLLQNLIEQNLWKTRFMQEAPEWFDFSETEGYCTAAEDSLSDVNYSVYVIDGILPSHLLGNSLYLFLPEPEKKAAIKQWQNDFYHKNVELFNSIIAESQSNKVIILTTKSIAPILDRIVTDYTLILCEHPALTISVGQTICGKTKNVYDKFFIK